MRHLPHHTEIIIEPIEKCSNWGLSVGFISPVGATIGRPFAKNFLIDIGFWVGGRPMVAPTQFYDLPDKPKFEAYITKNN